MSEIEFISRRELYVPARNLNERVKKRFCIKIIKVFFERDLDRHELTKSFGMNRNDVVNILHCDIEKVSLDAILEMTDKMSAFYPELRDTVKKLELV